MFTSLPIIKEFILILSKNKLPVFELIFIVTKLVFDYFVVGRNLRPGDDSFAFNLNLI